MAAAVELGPNGELYYHPGTLKWLVVRLDGRMFGEITGELLFEDPTGRLFIQAPITYEPWMVELMSVAMEMRVLRFADTEMVQVQQACMEASIVGDVSVLIETVSEIEIGLGPVGFVLIETVAPLDIVMTAENSYGLYFDIGPAE